jgi:protein LSM14
MSFGSEGRRGNPAEEVPSSTSVYEYIVFRGSDVKDISIASEEQKEPPQPEAPRVPDDPAILGVSDNTSSNNPIVPYVHINSQPIVSEN